jgi:hypothetical protein
MRSALQHTKLTLLAAESSFVQGNQSCLDHSFDCYPDWVSPESLLAHNQQHYKVHTKAVAGIS